jgi:hypothetical protein
MAKKILALALVALLALSLVPSLCVEANEDPTDAGTKVVSGVSKERESKNAGAHAASPSAASQPGGTPGGMDTTMLGGIFVAVVVGFAGVYFIFFAGESKPRFKGDAIFLIGPCGGGKTAMFFKLHNGGESGSELRSTQTSMIKNECKVTPQVRTMPKEYM